MSIKVWLRDHRPVGYAEVAAQRERLDEIDKFFAVLGTGPRPGPGRRAGAEIRAAERWGTRRAS